MQVEYEKLATTAGWSHVIIIGWPIIAYHTWADDRDDHVGVINNIQWRVARACISGQFFMMQAIKAASKINCPKNHSDPLVGRPLKILPPNVEKPTYGTELYHHANFANWREISVPRQKYIFFRIRNSPGGYCAMLYIFGKLLSSWF